VSTQDADDVRLWAIPNQMALAVIQMGDRATPVARAYADAWIREYGERAELVLANANAARTDGDVCGQ
jgi:hypothetical protein